MGKRAGRQAGQAVGIIGRYDESVREREWEYEREGTQELQMEGTRCARVLKVIESDGRRKVAAANRPHTPHEAATTSCGSNGNGKEQWNPK